MLIKGSTYLIFDHDVVFYVNCEWFDYWEMYFSTHHQKGMYDDDDDEGCDDDGRYDDDNGCNDDEDED